MFKGKLISWHRERGILRTRLNNAAWEMKLADVYDHAIINDDVNRAAEELVRLIMSYRKGGYKK